MSDECVVCGEAEEGKPLYKKLGSGEFNVEVITALKILQMLTIPEAAKNSSYICWDCDEIIVEQYERYLQEQKEVASTRKQNKKQQQNKKKKPERDKLKLTLSKHTWADSSWEIDSKPPQLSARSSRKQSSKNGKLAYPASNTSGSGSGNGAGGYSKSQQRSANAYHFAHCLMCDSSFENESRTYQRFSLKNRVSDEMDIAQVMEILGLARHIDPEMKARRYVCNPCFVIIRRSYKDKIMKEAAGVKVQTEPSARAPPFPQPFIRRATTEEHAAEIAKLLPPDLAECYKIMTDKPPTKKTEPTATVAQRIRSKKLPLPGEKEEAGFEEEEDEGHGAITVTEDGLGNYIVDVDERQTNMISKTAAVTTEVEQPPSRQPPNRKKNVLLPKRLHKHLAVNTSNTTQPTTTIADADTLVEEIVDVDTLEETKGGTTSVNVAAAGKMCSVCGITISHKPQTWWHALTSPTTAFDTITIATALKLLESGLASSCTEVAEEQRVCLPCYTKISSGFKCQVLQSVAGYANTDASAIDLSRVKVRMLARDASEAQSTAGRSSGGTRSLQSPQTLPTTPLLEEAGEGEKENVDIDKLTHKIKEETCCPERRRIPSRAEVDGTRDRAMDSSGRAAARVRSMPGSRRRSSGCPRGKDGRFLKKGYQQQPQLRPPTTHISPKEEELADAADTDSANMAEAVDNTDSVTDTAVAAATDDADSLADTAEAADSVTDTAAAAAAADDTDAVIDTAAAADDTDSVLDTAAAEDTDSADITHEAEMKPHKETEPLVILKDLKFVLPQEAFSGKTVSSHKIESIIEPLEESESSLSSSPATAAAGGLDINTSPLQMVFSALSVYHPPDDDMEAMLLPPPTAGAPKVCGRCMVCGSSFTAAATAWHSVEDNVRPPTLQVPVRWVCVSLAVYLPQLPPEDTHTAKVCEQCFHLLGDQFELFVKKKVGESCGLEAEAVDLSEYSFSFNPTTMNLEADPKQQSYIHEFEDVGQLLQRIQPLVEQFSVDDVVGGARQPVAEQHFCVWLLLVLNELRLQFGAAVTDLAKWLAALMPGDMYESGLRPCPNNLAAFLLNISSCFIKLTQELLEGPIPAWLFVAQDTDKGGETDKASTTATSQTQPEEQLLWEDFLQHVNFDALLGGRAKPVAVEHFSQGVLYAVWRSSQLLGDGEAQLRDWLRQLSPRPISKEELGELLTMVVALHTHLEEHPEHIHQLLHQAVPQPGADEMRPWLSLSPAAPQPYTTPTIHHSHSKEQTNSMATRVLSSKRKRSSVLNNFTYKKHKHSSNSFTTKMRHESDSSQGNCASTEEADNAAAAAVSQDIDGTTAGLSSVTEATEGVSRDTSEAAEAVDSTIGIVVDAAAAHECANSSVVTPQPTTLNTTAIEHSEGTVVCVCKSAEETPVTPEPTQEPVAPNKSTGKTADSTEPTVDYDNSREGVTTMESTEKTTDFTKSTAETTEDSVVATEPTEHSAVITEPPSETITVNDPPEKTAEVSVSLSEPAGAAVAKTSTHRTAKSTAISDLPVIIATQDNTTTLTTNHQQLTSVIPEPHYYVTTTPQPPQQTTHIFEHAEKTTTTSVPAEETPSHEPTKVTTITSVSNEETIPYPNPAEETTPTIPAKVRITSPMSAEKTTPSAVPAEEMPCSLAPTEDITVDSVGGGQYTSSVNASGKASYITEASEVNAGFTEPLIHREATTQPAEVIMKPEERLATCESPGVLLVTADAITDTRVTRQFSTHTPTSNGQCQDTSTLSKGIKTPAKTSPTAPEPSGQDVASTRLFNTMSSNANTTFTTTTKWLPDSTVTNINTSSTSSMTSPSQKDTPSKPRQKESLSVIRSISHGKEKEAWQSSDMHTKSEGTNTNSVHTYKDRVLVIKTKVPPGVPVLGARAPLLHRSERMCVSNSTANTDTTNLREGKNEHLLGGNKMAAWQSSDSHKARPRTEKEAKSNNNHSSVLGQIHRETCEDKDNNNSENSPLNPPKTASRSDVKCSGSSGSIHGKNPCIANSGRCRVDKEASGRVPIMKEKYPNMPERRCKSVSRIETPVQFNKQWKNVSVENECERVMMEEASPQKSAKRKSIPDSCLKPTPKKNSEREMTKQKTRPNKVSVKSLLSEDKKRARKARFVSPIVKAERNTPCRTSGKRDTPPRTPQIPLEKKQKLSFEELMNYDMRGLQHT